MQRSRRPMPNHLDLPVNRARGGRTARSSRERDDDGLCAGRETASRTEREEAAAAGLFVERWRGS